MRQGDLSVVLMDAVEVEVLFVNSNLLFAYDSLFFFNASDLVRLAS